MAQSLCRIISGMLSTSGGRVIWGCSWVATHVRSRAGAAHGCCLSPVDHKWLDLSLVVVLALDGIPSLEMHGTLRCRILALRSPSEVVLKFTVASKGRPALAAGLKQYVTESTFPVELGMSSQITARYHIHVRYIGHHYDKLRSAAHCL